MTRPLGRGLASLSHGVAMGWLVEALLDTGQRIQSMTFSLREDASRCCLDMAGCTMVEEVSILAVHTGEVVLLEPSLARSYREGPPPWFLLRSRLWLIDRGRSEG